jgi:hypothetical protein
MEVKILRKVSDAYKRACIFRQILANFENMHALMYEHLAKAMPAPLYKHGFQLSCRISPLLSACAYISAGRKPSLNNEVRLTARCA